MKNTNSWAFKCFLIALFSFGQAHGKIVSMSFGNKRNPVNSAFWDKLLTSDKTQEFSQGQEKAQFTQLSQTPLFIDVLPTIEPKKSAEQSLTPKFGTSLMTKSPETFADDQSLAKEKFSVVGKSGREISYYFFAGHGENKSKLVVICPGLSTVQKLVLPQAVPYLMLFNKHLGYSCLWIPYDGHFKTQEDNEFLNLHSFGAGKTESSDIIRCVWNIEERQGKFTQKLGFGACFGAAVLAMAQAKEPIFDAFLFCSPLTNSMELLQTILSKKDAFGYISGKRKTTAAKLFRSKKRRVLNKVLQTLLLVEKFSPPALILLCLLINHLKPVNPWMLPTAAIMALLCSAKTLLFGQTLVTKLIIYCAFKTQLLDYRKYFKKISVPTVYINSNFSHKNNTVPKGDVLVTKDSLASVGWNTQSKCAVFWSQGVDHLKNWAYEAEDFRLICKYFFNSPQEFLARLKHF